VLMIFTACSMAFARFQRRKPTQWVLWQPLSGVIGRRGEAVGARPHAPAWVLLLAVGIVISWPPAAKVLPPCGDKS
jgi:hypothetical protein